MEHLRQRLNPKGSRKIGNLSKGNVKPYGQLEDHFQVQETTL
jgi:hypothetical protein